ncbi:MAG: NIPSNAP family protein [Segetibacter sp.]
MKNLLSFLLMLTAFFVACTSTKTNSSSKTGDLIPSATMLQQNPFYEMRTYYAAPGKLDDLNARFRNNTMRIFAKHGMVNIGYWVPVDNPDNKLIYVLAYPTHEAREESWKAFSADPEWQAVAKASEANGKLVNKVETLYLEATDYSPALTMESKGPTRTFELRTYTASPGNMKNLDDRFRNHTLKLFEKHGITNIVYWHPTDKDKEAKSNLLVYLIAHKDQTSAEAAWKAFREDPVWVEAKNASEVKGGGSLTTNVESIFMLPTDYSPMK